MSSPRRLPPSAIVVDGRRSIAPPLDVERIMSERLRDHAAALDGQGRPTGDCRACGRLPAGMTPTVHQARPLASTKFSCSRHLPLYTAEQASTAGRWSRALGATVVSAAGMPQAAVAASSVQLGASNSETSTTTIRNSHSGNAVAIYGRLPHATNSSSSAAIKGQDDGTHSMAVYVQEAVSRHRPWSGSRLESHVGALPVPRASRSVAPRTIEPFAKPARMAAICLDVCPPAMLDRSSTVPSHPHLHADAVIWHRRRGVGRVA